MARRVSFLARGTTRRKVSFRAGGRKVSFKAKVPSKRRKKVCFYSTKKRG